MNSEAVSQHGHNTSHSGTSQIRFTAGPSSTARASYLYPPLPPLNRRFTHAQTSERGAATSATGTEWSRGGSNTAESELGERRAAGPSLERWGAAFADAPNLALATFRMLEPCGTR